MFQSLLNYFRVNYVITFIFGILKPSIDESFVFCGFDNYSFENEIVEYVTKMRLKNGFRIN